MNRSVTNEIDSVFEVYKNINIFLTSKGTFTATVAGKISNLGSLSAMKKLIDKGVLPINTVVLLSKRTYGMTGVVVTGPGVLGKTRSYGPPKRQFVGYEGTDLDSNPETFKIPYSRENAMLFEGDLITIVNYKDMMDRHRAETQALHDALRRDITSLMETLREISDEEILKRLYE